MNWKQKTPKREFSEFDDVIEKLAAVNGINDSHKFMNPSISDLNNVYDLNNIDTVARRIIEGIKRNEKIEIFGDNDNDGISSTVILYSYLKNLTDNVDYFYSQRSCGHGIEHGINKIPEGTQLLIILDSSTSSTESCKTIWERGIPILIVDHHPSEKDNPYAIIVNPQLDNSKNRELSGAGLTWKLCKVLDDILNVKLADDYLDIAATGMVGDMMDMRIPENRYIVNEGLNNVKNLGLIAILKKKNKNPQYINSTDIGYTIAPMLNACARQDRIELALELLTCNDADRCKELMKEIEDLNKQRQEKQTSFVEKFQDKFKPDDNLITVIDDTIGKNYSGLVANQLAQTYKKPALILIKDDNRYQGSFRSYGGFDLKGYFASLPQVIYTGGHSGAGGCQIWADTIREFIIAANKGLEGVHFEQDYEYDLEVDVNDINEDFIRKVKRFFKVSGKNIEEAKFRVKGLFVVTKDMLGKETKETIKIDCDIIELMKFKTNEEYYQQIPVYTEIEAVGRLNTNYFYHRGKKQMIVTNQLFLDDYKVVS